MMLSLLLLLALSSGSLQDFVKKRSQDLNVTSLNPDLEERVPEIPANTTALPYRRLSPAKLKQANTFSSTFNGLGKLKWLTWSGSLPNGSVSINNDYAGHRDYVCQYRCMAGFYRPSEGSYCHYPDEGKEYRVQSFEILVNEDNFEILEWKSDYSGSVPQHAVKTCVGSDEIYVGKNKYGLGKVHPKHKAFFLPWEGEEYWYKSYEVLTMNKDVASQHIYDVKYNTDAAEIVPYPPEIMHSSAIINRECSIVTETTTLSKDTQEQRTWHISSSIMVGISNTFTGGVPGITSAGIQISAAVTMEFSGGHTYTETISHSVSVEMHVPPNHSCKVRMLGYKYESNIPFNARLTRIYSNGEVKWTSISGTYNGSHIGQVKAEVDRCQPLTDAMPCSIIVGSKRGGKWHLRRERVITSLDHFIELVKIGHEDSDDQVNVCNVQLYRK